MPESVRIPVEEGSQVAEARRVARKLANSAGLNSLCEEQVAIVVTEATTNILKHAGAGEILLNVTEGLQVEVLALDRGPGMDDLNLCLGNGYSTAGSPGHGLGAIVRLSAQSDFHTAPHRGTALLARWNSGANPRETGPGSVLRIGAVSIRKRGQDVCGDSWAAEQNGEITTVMVADGLGHGQEASIASCHAVRILRENPDVSPLGLLDLAHRALRSSRGAAISIARIDRGKENITFCGVGNVAAQAYSGSRSARHLVCTSGTAGHEVRRPREFIYPWPENGLLVIHSDGLSTSTGLIDQPSLALRDSTLIAGVLYRDFARGNDDATVVVLKAA